MFVSLISFISVLWFSAYRFCVFLGRFVPRHFILFVAMVNGIVSLTSLSDFLLLMYRSTRYFCVLILYPATLLYSLTSSSNFLIFFRVFLCIVACHLQSFTSFLPIWSPLVYFSSLITVTRTSKTILSNSGKSEHSSLVPDCKGNTLFFTIDNNVFCGFVIYGRYYVEVCSF